MIRPGASHGLAILQSTEGLSVRSILEDAIELDGTDPKEAKAPWRLIWEPTLNPTVVRDLTKKAGASEFSFVCDGTAPDAQERLDTAKIGRRSPTWMRLTLRRDDGFTLTDAQLEKLVRQEGATRSDLEKIFKAPALFAADATDITARIKVLGKMKTYSLFRPESGAISEQVDVRVDADGNPTHGSLWDAAWEIFTFLAPYQPDLQPSTK